MPSAGFEPVIPAIMRLQTCALEPEDGLKRKAEKCISMFHRAIFSSIIDKHQHMHFFTFKTVLV